MLKVAYASIYKYDLPPGHRFPMEKYMLLPEQLLYEGTIGEEDFFEPDCLDEETILLAHTRTYWEKLNTLSLTRKEARKIGFPVTARLVERGRYIAGGTLQGARHALEHGIALNIAGGTHHAFADSGGGFCVFNDFAIAARALLRDKVVKQILIVDLDVHQGDGTAHIFRHEPRVFTFSMHGENNYPLRKQRSDLDIGLKDGTGDAMYLDILKGVLPKLVNRVKPDLVMYLAGVDVIQSDKLGRLAMSVEGCKARDRIVFRYLAKHEIPVVVSMGGGYSERLADIIECHANTYRVAQVVYG